MGFLRRCNGFFRTATLLVWALGLLACASGPSPPERYQNAVQLAAAHGWQAQPVQGNPFRLMAFLPPNILPSGVSSPDLTVYLEGDGFAWVTASQPSDDPTPHKPLALQLALEHPAGNAAYLARPCQYTDAKMPPCAPRYWTSARFAQEVIDSTDTAISALKARFGAQRLALVGYSGGGAVAALVAAQRSDVDLLVTVAGNLDPVAWARYHHVTPLYGSRSPVEEIAQLGGIRQRHFAGARDGIMPPALAQAFADRFPTSNRPVVSIEPQFDHQCCWAESWPQLWERASSVHE